MLIIEGPDGLGKTTLAKKIQRKVSDLGLPIVYSYMTRPNEDKFDFFNSYRELINYCAVQDRFHLSGLAYHDDLKTNLHQRNIQAINSWIRSVGGLIVVLYASDQEWYRQNILASTEKHIVDTPVMCEANRRYTQYAQHNDCDYSFDISFGHRTTGPEYVSEISINEIINEWLIRRKNLGLGDI